MMELPPDLIERIMMELDRVSLYQTMLSCSRLDEIANGELVWRALIKSQFGLSYLKKPEPSWKEIFQLVHAQKLALPHYQSEKIMGCSHYQRGVMIQAPCCQKFYPCHVCHDEDEQEDHRIDRFKIETMVCMLCGTVQPSAKNCVSCSLELASYYCEMCGMWSSDSERPLYPC